MKNVTNKKIVEDFNIFLNSLYEHNSIDDNKIIIEKFAKDIKRISGKNCGMVEVKMTLADGKTLTSQCFLEDAVKLGLDLPEDVSSFKVSVHVHKSRKIGDVKESFTMKDVFKSTKFIVKQNSKTETVEEGAIVIKDMLFYQDMTNNRIRFGQENVFEV